MSLHNLVLRVIDTETTGLDHVNDRVVEIAAVDVAWSAGGGWGYSPRGATLVNPDRPIPPETSAIHHIVDDDVRDAPYFAEIAEHFEREGAAYNELIEIDAFAAHNAAFDSAFCNFIAAPWLCTHRLALHLWPEAPKHSNQVLRYWLGLDVTLPEGLYPHRALADAIVTAKLLIRELEELERRNVFGELLNVTPADLIAWSARPAELVWIPFRSRRGERWADADESFLLWVLDRDFEQDIHHTARRCLDRLYADEVADSFNEE